jgi:Papain-like cysteine protease AvrRpt2
MPFPMEQQRENNWCWDAVSVSLEHYFDPASTMTQDDFAVKALGVPLKDADLPFYLSVALTDLELLNGDPLDGFLSFSDIQAQLAANLPVCVKIGWNEGGFHYLIISGYGLSPAGDPQLHVSDPVFLDLNVTVWDYAAFVFTYSPSYTNAEGAWVNTMLVKP